MNRELAITTVVMGLAHLAQFVPVPVGYRYEFDATHAAAFARARPRQRSIFSCFVAVDDPHGDRDVAVVVGLDRLQATFSRGRTGWEVFKAMRGQPAKDYPELFDAIVNTLSVIFVARAARCLLDARSGPMASNHPGTELHHDL